MEENKIKYPEYVELATDALNLVIQFRRNRSHLDRSWEAEKAFFIDNYPSFNKEMKLDSVAPGTHIWGLFFFHILDLLSNGTWEQYQYGDLKYLQEGSSEPLKNWGYGVRF
jgi:hypothetical protein